MDGRDGRVLALITSSGSLNIKADWSLEITWAVGCVSLSGHFSHKILPGTHELPTGASIGFGKAITAPTKSKQTPGVICSVFFLFFLHSLNKLALSGPSFSCQRSNVPGCGSSWDCTQKQVGTFTLTSPAFSHRNVHPAIYSCSGFPPATKLNI